jgi:hypothetical protein
METTDVKSKHAVVVGFYCFHFYAIHIFVSTFFCNLIKVSGLSSSEDSLAQAVPTIKLQLSSPIEELVLTQLFDPLSENSNLEESNGSRAIFSDVDTSSMFISVFLPYAVHAIRLNMLPLKHPSVILIFSLLSRNNYRQGI